MINDIKVVGHANIVKRNNMVVDVDQSSYKAAKARRTKEHLVDNLIKKTNEMEFQINGINDKLDALIQLIGRTNNDQDERDGK